MNRRPEGEEGGGPSFLSLPAHLGQVSIREDKARGASPHAGLRVMRAASVEGTAEDTGRRPLRGYGKKRLSHHPAAL